MKKVNFCFAVALFLVVGTNTVLGQDRGTLSDARNMVKKGAALTKKFGKDFAINEFNKLKSHYIYKDIYVFATDDKGIVLAHPYRRELVGRNVMNLKDVDGKMFIKEAIESVKKNGGSCTIGYRWPHPRLQTLEKKETYAELVMGVVLFSGSYE